jgi:hypothetical protein
LKTVFLKLFLILSITITLAEVLFGLILPKLVLGSGDTYINRWHDFFTKKSGADLVCLGSSRIHRHCDPSIISKETHLKTEIVANAGAQFYFFEKLYEDFLKTNPKPKLLVVGIDLTGLGNKKFVPDPEYFFPFIKPSNAIAGFDEYNFIKYHKPLGYFYYKEIYLDLIQNSWLRPHDAGYLPEEKPSVKEAFLGVLPKGFTLDLNDETIKHIFQFMSDQQKGGVACIGIISPEYFPVWTYENNRHLAMAKLYKEASQEHVRIINFSDSAYSVCFNKNLFFNSQHLNKAGAEIFSHDLADSINKYYP